MFTGEPSGVTLLSIRDGTSKTLLVVEAARPVPWSKPEDLSLTANAPALGMGSKHPGGFNVALADGAVRFVRPSGDNAISPQHLRALVTRDGGEEVEAP